MLLRLFYAQTRSYFNNCDELISVSTTVGLPVYGNMPINETFTTKDLTGRGIEERLWQCANSGDNGNSYFFNLVLSFWVDVFGPGDFSFRFFTSLCDCLSILVLFAIGQRLQLNKTSALLSCALLCISPVFLMYGGGFIRTYGFTTLLILITIYYFIKAYQNPFNRKYYIVILFLCIAAFFSHFLTYYIFFAFFIFALLKRKEHSVFFKTIFLTFLIFGLVSIVLLYLNKNGISNMQKGNSGIQSSVNSVADLENSFNGKNIILSVSKYVFTFYAGIFSMVGFANGMGLKIIPFSLFYVLFLFPVILFFIQYRKILKEERYLLLWLLVICSNISALAMMVMSKHFTSLDLRYTLFSVPCFYLLVTQIDFKKNAHCVFLSIYFAIICISTLGTYNRYSAKEINVTLSAPEFNKELYVSDLPTIKKYLINEAKKLNPGHLLCFNNIQEYLFFTLMTNNTVSNYCIIDKKFPKGLTSSSGFKIEFIYNGDC
ncbi:MAG: glycosyltransferase family 39 protein [Bacteroidetes bacterium]|nr:glycosyltransferase family 39 protein [Bacteroidota bacterium]